MVHGYGFCPVAPISSIFLFLISPIGVLSADYSAPVSTKKLIRVPSTLKVTLGSGRGLSPVSPRLHHHQGTALLLPASFWGTPGPSDLYLCSMHIDPFPGAVYLFWVSLAPAVSHLPGPLTAYSYLFYLYLLLWPVFESEFVPVFLAPVLIFSSLSSFSCFSSSTSLL